MDTFRCWGKQKFYDQNIEFIDSRVRRLSKIFEQPQNSGRQNGHMTHVTLPKTPQISGGVLTKSGRQGDLATEICAPLDEYKHRTVMRRPKCQEIFRNSTAEQTITTTVTTTEVIKTRITKEEKRIKHAIYDEYPLSISLTVFKTFYKP